MDRVSKAEREFVRKMQRTTNGDRIRAMTDEELAEFLNSNAWYRVIKGVAFTNETWTLDWLKQEATE